MNEAEHDIENYQGRDLRGLDNVDIMQKLNSTVVLLCIQNQKQRTIVYTNGTHENFMLS